MVEAGALLGGSTVHLAKVASSVVSIDKHEGYSAPTYRQYRSNLTRYGAYNVVPIIGDALSALPLFSGDVAFVDLTGERALTTNAILSLHKDISLVAVHDYGRPHCDIPSVVRGWRVWRRADTLLVLERHNNHG